MFAFAIVPGPNFFMSRAGHNSLLPSRFFAGQLLWMRGPSASIDSFLSVAPSEVLDQRRIEEQAVGGPAGQPC